MNTTTNNVIDIRSRIAYRNFNEQIANGIAQVPEPSENYWDIAEGTNVLMPHGLETKTGVVDGLHLVWAVNSETGEGYATRTGIHVVNGEIDIDTIGCNLLEMAIFKNEKTVRFKGLVPFVTQGKSGFDRVIFNLEYTFEK